MICNIKWKLREELPVLACISVHNCNYRKNSDKTGFDKVNLTSKLQMGFLFKKIKLHLRSCVKYFSIELQTQCSVVDTPNTKNNT